MAECILMKGGGGIESEDVTASSADVLKGKTTIMANSNDEVVSGTMPNLTDETPIRYTSSNATKVLGGDGVFIGDNTDGNRRILVRYNGEAGYLKPNTLIGYPAGGFGDALVDDVRAGSKFASYNGVALTGTLKQFDGMATTGYADVYASENDVRTWGYNGKQYAIIHVGQGVMAKRTNFIASYQPDILAANIKAGKKIFGVTGTLVDYSSGRVGFNGANFDGAIISGLAEKGFRAGTTYYLRPHAQTRYNGIYDGGINLIFDTRAFTSSIGVTMAHSINLKPFSRIVITYKADFYINQSATRSPSAVLYTSLYSPAGITYTNVSINGVGETHGIYISSSLLTSGSTTVSSGVSGSGFHYKDTVGTITLDTSGLGEQAYLSIGLNLNGNSGTTAFEYGRMLITKIEFLN